ncbi:MAG: carbohydrate porin [Candidatus Baltobacteraceae bacterium]
MQVVRILAACATIVVAPIAALAAADQQSTGPATQAAATPTPSPSPNGEENAKPDLLDGTLSAKGELEEDEATAEQSPLPPFAAAKQRFEERTGITFGGSIGVLWQGYSSTIVGQGQANGGKFAFDLNAPIANQGKPNNLTFDMAVEARGPLGTDFAPLQAGILAGSGTATAATWGNFGIGITQAYLRQSLAGNRFQWTIGKLFAPNYVDAYPFFDDNRQFLNLAFATSPTIAVPLRGFGFVAAGFPGENNVYLTGGMFTANSSDTGSTIGDFFSRPEHFYFLEVGQTGFARAGVPINARGPLDSNNFHITLWYRDPLAPRGPGDLLRPSPDAYGAAFSANYMAGQNVMWFLRGGVGSGSNFGTGALAGGIGWRPGNRPRDLFGVGVGWTNPSLPEVQLPVPVPIPDVRSQTTSEIFYRFALMPNIALTPDYQLLYHPSLAVSRPTLSVISLRARLTF